MYFLQKIKCPYCGKENYGDDNWHGIPYDEKKEFDEGKDNTYTCEHCEKEFKIEMEFTASKTKKL